MSDTALTVILVALLPLAVGALTAALVALRRTSPRRRVDAGAPLPTDLAGLRGEVGRLRDQAAVALRHLAVVRYDAFGDMGGRLSWSVALADDRGDGLVLTSIAGRSDSRTYAKGLQGWAADQPLSPEEEEAVTRAKAG